MFFKINLSCFLIRNKRNKNKGLSHGGGSHGRHFVFFCKQINFFNKTRYFSFVAENSERCVQIHRIHHLQTHDDLLGAADGKDLNHMPGGRPREQPSYRVS